MYRTIPVEEVIASLPKDEQEAIEVRGRHLLAEAYERFRAKVQEALDDPRPAIPREQVKEYFAKRRAAALQKKHR